jgi:hypothetical protein
LAKVFSRYHDVPWFYVQGKLGIAGFQNVFQDLRPGFKNQIGSDDPVCGDVVAELPTAAAGVHVFLL